MKTAHRCCGMIWHNYSEYKCSKKAKFERDGKWYCGTHDPEAVKARREARSKKYVEELEKERKFRESIIAEKKEIERKAAMYDELLETLDELANGYSGCMWDTGLLPRIERARAAVAKAKGER